MAIWDLFSGEDSQDWLGPVNKVINKVLVVAASGTAILVVSVAGIGLAYIYKDKAGSVFKSDSMLSLKRGLILGKWFWEKIDPFIYDFAEKKGAESLKKMRYRIDQFLDMVDDFIKAPEIIKIFRG